MWKEVVTVYFMVAPRIFSEAEKIAKRSVRKDGLLAKTFQECLLGVLLFVCLFSYVRMICRMYCLYVWSEGL
jgi:hypothetical protein